MTRRSAIVLAAGCAVLLAAWFVLLWSPKGNELAEASARRTDAEDQAEQLEIRLTRLQEAEEGAPRLVAAQDRLRSAVPEQANLAQFILDANDAANAAGVEFVSIAPTQPSASATPGVPAEIGVSIEIKGGYFQMLDYLDRLYELPRVIVLDRISATPDGVTGNLAVSLGGRMFSTQVPAAPGVDPAAATTTDTTVVPGSGEAVAAALETIQGSGTR
jgi:Tfp pilus assembly protein PilO